MTYENLLRWKKIYADKGDSKSLANVERALLKHAPVVEEKPKAKPKEEK